MGVQVCDQAGRVNCILPLAGERQADGHLCFGGDDFDTMFVGVGDRVLKRKVKVKGARPGPFAEPIKPGPPRL